MKINLYTMLKTLLFTLQNGKSLSSGMHLLATAAQTKKERNTYLKIYDALKDGSTFSGALKANHIGSSDVLQFIAMAEKSVSFKSALEKIINYLEVKEEFERESNDKITLPFIYFTLASLVVLGTKFIAVPIQMERAKEYSQEIINLIGNHLAVAQIMTDALFISLLVVASYFMILMIALFSHSNITQGIAKQIGLVLPIISKIVVKFEKFMLFSLLGEMLQGGISFKNSIQSAIDTSTVSSFKNALKESLRSIKNDGKFIFHSTLYDDIEKGLLLGVGSSFQVGAVMLEISSRARTDALKLTTKFFRMITFLSIFLLAFAVFIEFYTIVLTQILIQKGLIDLTRGPGAF
ncbi:MAG: type II secretion system F family protein [Sulfurimonas sp.]|nr:type II secretion system F family protein [Sulfurimonas sp.]